MIIETSRQTGPYLKVGGVFARFTIHRKRPPRLTNIQPFHGQNAFGQSLWSSMSKKVRRRAKPQWDEEEPKLEAARQLSETYDVPRGDEDSEDIVGNARKKFEFCMEPALPCIPIGEKSLLRLTQENCDVYLVESNLLHALIG